MEINKEDFNWTGHPVVGIALILTNHEAIDSFGDPIKGDIFYEVGKHKESGKVAIIPTNRNQKHEFINDIMKRNNKFN